MHRKLRTVAVALSLPLFALSCQKPAPATETPVTAPPQAEPAPPPQEEPEPAEAVELVDAWFNDMDADGVPDFVELELNTDPKIDECITAACGADAVSGRLASRINTLVILDASGSMAGKLGKGTKLDAAKRAIRRYVEVMPKSEVMNLGMMVYGHVGDNTLKGQPESCNTVQMALPLAAIDVKAVDAAMKPLKPTGWSPIAKALEASDQFLPEQVGQVNHVILVADGIEACEGDPTTVARQLRQTGKITRMDVVGFGIDAKQDSAALLAIAEAAGGRYVEANSVAEFDQAFNLLSMGIWSDYDAWLCAVGSAPLLECYSRRAEEAIARTEQQVAWMSKNAKDEEASASLQKVKTRIEAMRDGRQRVVTTYKVNLDKLRSDAEMQRKKAKLAK
ncbi:MAG: VWA domain-containing protein [Nannocystis sp.]|nr:VWA domain-containing protein [Nannocystis sp.]